MLFKKNTLRVFTKQIVHLLKAFWATIKYSCAGGRKADKRTFMDGIAFIDAK